MGSQLAPIVHSVHFYETDEALIQRLGSIVLSGFRAGVSALLVLDEEHASQFRPWLKARGIDLLWAEREGEVFIVDAHEALGQFMNGKMPDPSRFESVIGQLIDTAAAASQRSGLTVFGEMVAILWQQGNKDGAIALERLWNTMLERKSFHLHCGYPKAFFGSANASAEIGLICEEHSLAVGVANVAA